jgi:hypothetical protein
MNTYNIVIEGKGEFSLLRIRFKFLLIFKGVDRRGREEYYIFN